MNFKQHRLTKAKTNAGFTLIETLVYVGVLSFVGLVVVVFISQILGVSETSRRSREALDNARFTLDTIVQEVRQAKGVYSPTSSFGGNSDQLSLETLRDVPSDEKSTFVDIYLDNGAVYLKREGSTDELLTSQKVKVTKLNFTDLNGSSGRDAIEISISVEYNQTVSGPKNAVTLTTTAAPRSY